ncbi:protein TOPAZ1-like [Engraulis encrasicolus]
MAVCLEMFISRCLPDSTQNPSKVHAPMVILKRESESGVRAVESVYLAAGCTLLSSAQLLNPKLRLSYTITSGQQQQVYTIDPGSAHKWLHGNSSWACKLWPV